MKRTDVTNGLFLEDAAIEALSVLVAVDKSIPFRKRLPKVISKLRFALDGNTDSNVEKKVK